jgi:hypothetical protein
MEILSAVNGHKTMILIENLGSKAVHFNRILTTAFKKPRLL